eukprot:365839-Chlamydomonas_euryale.AAC.6
MLQHSCGGRDEACGVCGAWGLHAAALPDLQCCWCALRVGRAGVAWGCCVWEVVTRAGVVPCAMLPQLHGCGVDVSPGCVTWTRNLNM